MVDQIHGFLRKVAPVVALLGMFLLGTGCQTTSRHLDWYQGPQRATNEVGLLKLPCNPLYGYSLFAQTIDGTNIVKGMAINNANQIELLPGNHTVGLLFFAGYWQSDSEYRISFDCEAGHVYGAFMSPTQISRHDMDVKDFLGGIRGDKCLLTAWIVDGQTGRVVAGHRDTKYFISTGCMTGYRNRGKGNRLATHEYAPQDMVGFDLSVLVDDLADHLKPGEVVIKWYAGDEIVAESHGEDASFTFDHGLNTIRLKKNASSLGWGHFKVSAFIEGEEVASQEFQVGS